MVKTPQFFFYPLTSYLSKNVIESSIEELILFRDAIKKYQKELIDEYINFSDFVKNSNLYNQQEKDLILKEHFDFSLNYYEENSYSEKMAKIDFRGRYSKKAQEDEKMFAELFPGKKLY